jgi:hypothetical protein
MMYAHVLSARTKCRPNFPVQSNTYALTLRDRAAQRMNGGGVPKYSNGLVYILTLQLSLCCLLSVSFRTFNVQRCFCCGRCVGVIFVPTPPTRLPPAPECQDLAELVNIS